MSQSDDVSVKPDDMAWNPLAPLLAGERVQINISGECASCSENAALYPELNGRTGVVRECLTQGETFELRDGIVRSHQHSNEHDICIDFDAPIVIHPGYGCDCVAGGGSFSRAELRRATGGLKTQEGTEVPLSP